MESRERSIEDVLRDYAQPFAALGNQPHASRAALDAAAAIWDLVLDGCSNHEILERLDEDLDAHWAKIVDAFVERKHLLFEADRRYVVGSRIAAKPQS